MTTTSPIFELPAPELSDGANIEEAVQPLVDRLEEILATLGAAPVAAMLDYAGVGDPPLVPGAPIYLLCDGRLLPNRATTYAVLFAEIGHAFNGGVDPGGGQVRIPDCRGRVALGADNMGTAQAAAGRLPNSLRALGQAAGEERHTLTAAEGGVAAHGHADTFDVRVGGAHLHGAGSIGGAWAIAAVGGSGRALAPLPNNASSLTFQDGSGLLGGSTATAPDHDHVLDGAVTNHAGAAGTAHNNLQPYVVTNKIIRVA